MVSPNSLFITGFLTKSIKAVPELQKYPCFHAYINFILSLFGNFEKVKLSEQCYFQWFMLRLSHQNRLRRILRGTILARWKKWMGNNCGVPCMTENRWIFRVNDCLGFILLIEGELEGLKRNHKLLLSSRWRISKVDCDMTHTSKASLRFCLSNNRLVTVSFTSFGNVPVSLVFYWCPAGFRNRVWQNICTVAVRMITNKHFF